MNMQLPSTEKGIWLHTLIRRDGSDMVLDGWLVAGTKTKVFSLRADIRPIVAAVVKAHIALHKQHGLVAGTCIGCDDDGDDEVLCVGCDDDELVEIGSRRSRRRRRRARKARRVARRVARRGGKRRKIHLGRGLRRKVRRIAKSKLARGVVRAVKKHGLKAALVTAAAAASPFTGGASLAAIVPIAASAYASAKAADKTLKDINKSGLKKGAEELTGKVGQYARKVTRKTRSKLLARAHKKGLFKKFGAKKLGRAINKITKRVLKKKLGRIKSPRLTQSLKQLTPRLQKVNDARAKVRDLLKRAPHDPKAMKAKRILATVAQHHERVAQLGKRMDQRGSTGLVVDDQGRIRKGRFVATTRGTGTPDVLYTQQGVKRGHYNRVAGDCVGGDCVGDGRFPVAVEGCVGCGNPVPAYPVGNVLIRG